MNFSDKTKYGLNSLLTNKNVKIQDMINTYQNLKTAGDNRLIFADSWEKLALSLQTMVLSQDPYLMEKMKQFVDYCKEIKESEIRLANAEIRSAEDFRDVFERYAVMFRINEELLEARKRFNAYKEALNQAKIKREKAKTKEDYAEKHQKLVEKCTHDKKDAVELVKQKYNELISERERYNAFKLRRMLEGWTRYGHTLKVESDAQDEIFAKIIELLQAMKNESPVNEENLQKMEDAIQAKIEQDKPQEDSPVKYFNPNLTAEEPEHDHSDGPERHRANDGSIENNQL